MTGSRLFGALIFGTLSLFALTARAEPTHELLVPLDKATEAKLRRSTNYELREQLYPAKRFRLVNINFDVLDIPGGEIAITAFPDSPFRLITTNTNETPDDGYRMWAGELLSSFADDDRKPVRLFVYQGAPQPPSKRVLREIEDEGGVFDNLQI